MKFIILSLIFVFSISTSAFSAGQSKLITVEDDQYHRITLRDSVVESATYAYEKLNKNSSYGKHYDFSSVAHVWSTGKSDDPEIGVSLFYKGKGEDLGKNIELLLDSKLSLECSVAMRIVEIFSLKQLIGDERLGTLYSFVEKTYQKAGQKNQDIFINLISLFKDFSEESSPEKLFYGFMYVPNVPEYARYIRNGSSQGENVFTHQGRYWGFGPLFTQRPKKIDDIYVYLKKQLLDGNENEQVPEAIKDKYKDGTNFMTEMKKQSVFLKKYLVLSI